MENFGHLSDVNGTPGIVRRPKVIKRFLILKKDAFSFPLRTKKIRRSSSVVSKNVLKVTVQISIG